MKYLCKTKNSNLEWGVGDTLEAAYDDYFAVGGETIKDAEWFTLHPINVKLAVSASNVAKKALVVNKGKK